MSDLNEKLKELLSRRGVMTGAQWRQQHEEREQQRQSGLYEIDKLVPGELVGDPSNGFYLVRTDLPIDTLQGGVPLSAVLESAPEHIAFSAADDELASFDPMTTVFIDTETSGLAGGTGTVTFLIGIGYFTEIQSPLDAPSTVGQSGDCPQSTHASSASSSNPKSEIQNPKSLVFRLDQCFMRDFDDEEPMLHYVDEVFRRADTVVTFNGKTFDVPLLRTRFLFNRIPFRLDAAMHYDLVHVARRIWKLRLNDCSLGNIEREVLDIRRHGDVPGAEIPQIWFDYLRTRDASRLSKVFYHHKMDILSLVALTAVVSQRLGIPQGEGFDHAEDRLSVVRMNFRQKKFEDALAHAQKLLEVETEQEIRRHALEMCALACKKMQDWRQMAEVFTLMHQEFPSDLVPRLELAKHYEHRERDIQKALQMCLDTANILLTPQPDLQRRIDRLQRKLNSKPGNCDGLTE